MFITEKIPHSCDHCGYHEPIKPAIVEQQEYVQHNVQIYLYSQWLEKQGRKPKKFIAILKGLTNDLKKIGALEHGEDLLLINHVSVLTNLLNQYLEHEPYKAKNERGNNYYSAPFKKYIKFIAEYYKTK